MLYLKPDVFGIDVVYIAFDIERAATYDAVGSCLHGMSSVALPDLFDLRRM
jgi:hypothetical protein